MNRKWFLTWLISLSVERPLFFSSSEFLNDTNKEKNKIKYWIIQMSLYNPLLQIEKKSVTDSTAKMCPLVIFIKEKKSSYRSASGWGWRDGRRGRCRGWRRTWVLEKIIFRGTWWRCCHYWLGWRGNNETKIRLRTEHSMQSMLT